MYWGITAIEFAELPHNIGLYSNTSTLFLLECTYALERFDVVCTDTTTSAPFLIFFEGSNESLAAVFEKIALNGIYVINFGLVTQCNSIRLFISGLLYCGFVVSQNSD